MSGIVDTLLESFANLHAWLFESVVLPLFYQLGLAGFAEQAFDGTEFFLVGAIEIALLALFLGAIEKWRPLERPQRGPDQRVDIIYTFLNRLGLVPLVVFLALLPVVDAIDGWMRFHDLIPAQIEDGLPSLKDYPLLSFVLYLLVIDFVGYWVHRAQHRFDWWWALHSLHHSQRHLRFWSDNRNHFLDDLIRDGVFSITALLIGVAPNQFVALLVVTRMAESLSHINSRIGFGKVGERLLVDPHFHRVHHAIGLGHEGRARGCNFAVLFPVWDVLFGTASYEPVWPETGIRDQLSGADYGSRLWRQQWLGLKRLWVSVAGAREKGVT